MIRQELASQLSPSRRRRRGSGARRGRRSRSTSRELCERAGITADLARDLEEYGLISAGLPWRRALLHGGGRRDRGLRAAGSRPRAWTHGICGRSGRRPIAPRACSSRSSTPALRSRNAERHQEGLERLRVARRGGRGADAAAALEGAPAGRGRVRLGSWPSISDRRSATCPTFRSRASSSRTSCRSWPIRAALAETVERLAEWSEPRKPDLVLGAEARGYITGGALACRLGCGFVPARKPGKLPWHTVAVKYALEYGFDQLEVHADAITAGKRVLVHDDVLATGGTAKATAELVEQLGGTVVGLPFIIELAFLDGREKLDGLRRLLADRVLADPTGTIYTRPSARSSYMRACTTRSRLATRSPVRAREHASVPLSAFREIERLPGAAHPAVFRVRFACACGDEHDGLLAHDDLDWAPLGVGEERALRQSHDEPQSSPSATSSSDLAVRRITAGRWPWVLFCYPEGRRVRRSRRSSGCWRRGGARVGRRRRDAARAAGVCRSTSSRRPTSTSRSTTTPRWGSCGTLYRRRRVQTLDGVPRRALVRDVRRATFDSRRLALA